LTPLPFEVRLNSGRRDPISGHGVEMLTNEHRNEFEKPDIVEVLEREGVELKRRGKDLWGCCPLHKERTPSFKVNVERQKFYCFGCHRYGDVIDFVMLLHDVDFEGALKVLRMKGVKGRDPEERKKDEALRRFNAWCMRYHDELARQYRAYTKLTDGLRTPEEVSLRAWVFNELPVIEDRMRVLLEGTDKEKFDLWVEVTGGRF